MGSALLSRPTDEAVACSQVPGSRRPGQSRHWLALGVNEVFQMLADRSDITQVMVCLQEAAEEFFGRRASDLMDPRHPNPLPDPCEDCQDGLFDGEASLARRKRKPRWNSLPLPSRKCLLL